MRFIFMYTRVMDVFSLILAAWGNLGSILNSQGKFKEAEDAYKLALQQRGNMADVHYNL